MAIAPTANGDRDTLNTVAVVPVDIEQSTTTSRGTSASSSISTVATARSLAAAASNLITAIAQGSNSIDTLRSIDQDAQSDAGSEQGSSSFTYTAPARSATDIEQQGWYTSLPYHISNRYYDADVALKATKEALCMSNRIVEPSQGTVLSQAYPAYLVVVDRSRSLEYHRVLAASLESTVASGFDTDISIVAGVSLITSSHPQLVTALEDGPASYSLHRPQTSQASTMARSSDLVALYADHGWEFIPIDELEANDSEGAQSLDANDAESVYDTDRDDDKDGIERIREALMNHMWNGLIRKDQTASLSNRNASLETGPALFASSDAHPSFSDSAVGRFKGDEEDTDPAEAIQDSAESALEPSSLRHHLATIGDSFSDNTGFPMLDSNAHADASDLDEQLAKLFLSANDGARAADLAQLEAFLESQDPSWPASTPPSKSAADPESADARFDDDFDDFLPFQSALNDATQSTSQNASADVDDLPTMDDISQMQNHLFGGLAAARIEANPPGAATRSNSTYGDLASQLQQLQMHAQRVRNITDADQRRKEAALVALAFSMQWSNTDEDQVGSDADVIAF